MKEFDVFISHASEDKYIARLLRGYFRAHNIHSWLDQDQFKATMSRDDQTLEETIIPAIKKSRYFVLLLSENSAEKKWVRQEWEAACGMAAAGDELVMVVILLDQRSAEQVPDWVGGAKYFNLQREDGEHDPLETLRDDIGADKATYIGKVKPNFLKQIPMREVDEHLNICLGEALQMYLVDGAGVLHNFIQPAIVDALREGRQQRLHCDLLLMDSKLLQGPSLWSGNSGFQKRLDALLDASDIRGRKGAQDAFVRESALLMQENADRFDGFSYEIRLCERLPSGRFIFTGDIGFFSPLLSPPEITSPVFIFDDNSPYYRAAKLHFDEVYAQARLFARSASGA
ncbi:MAG: toll/interleukin-1 receptor domain-containing protein [Neomegalonema sp.]|nr:toll/interleukin-1 receptor domain-containing protein [Neomegalonema sp.]